MDMDGECRECLEGIVAGCRRIFGGQLTGVYLHGSLAMGCFNPEKSDLDLIVVTEKKITAEQKMGFMKEIVRLDGQAPAKGIELSVVLREHCRDFVHPTPFELHFSDGHLKWFQDSPWDYVEKMQGTDRDLASHFMIIRSHGIVLYGEEIVRVFAPVPKEAYMDSIWYDVEGAREGILEDPVYVILNLCRAEAFRREELVLSKVQGGRWGMENLPGTYHPLIRRALESYRSRETTEADWTGSAEFAGYMLGLMKETYAETAGRNNP